MKKLLLAVCAIILCVTSLFSISACSKKVKIGVQAGTTGEYYIKGNVDWEFEGFSNINCKGYSNGGLAVTDLKNGNLKYVVIDEAPASYLAEKVSGIKVIDIKLTEEEYAFGVNKNDNNLLTKVNEYLEKIKTDGTFDNILNNYFGNGNPAKITSATFDASKADKQLVVATNAAFAPFEYKEGDKFSGIDMEIAKGIADYLDMELVISDMDFDSVVTSVGSNNVDIAMAGLTVNDKRKESVNFSNSYYQASQKIICLANDTSLDNCKTAEDVEAVIKAL